jgi:hypothetical protein
MRLPADVFVCDAEPAPWAPDASDPDVAANIRSRDAAGATCRRQLHLVCTIAQANDLLGPGVTCPS